MRRRRWQRQFDDAATAGYTLSPRSPGSRKRYLGVKPKIHDTWVTQGGHKWAEMMVSNMPITCINLSRSINCCS
jgi:hypothetical protein